MHTAQPSQPLSTATPPVTIGAVESTPPASSPPAHTDLGVWVSELEPSESPLIESVAEVLGDEPLVEMGMYRLPPGFLLSVVMPVYNERQTLLEIVRRVQSVAIPKELVIVDDASTDGTRELLAELEHAPGVRVIYQPHNQGKGAALRTGFAAARGDVVLIQDADLEYDPSDYPRLLRPIVTGDADVVYGSRYLGGRPNNQTPWHRLANQLLTGLSNVLSRQSLTDMETCYKVFRREALASLRLEQDRFGIEPELTAKIARRRWRVTEVPVAYHGRDYAAGKKIRLKDAFQAVYCIVRYGLAD